MSFGNTPLSCLEKTIQCLCWVTLMHVLWSKQERMSPYYNGDLIINMGKVHFHLSIHFGCIQAACAKMSASF